ncbi:MAG: DNA polymerase III subunit beta [Patescibacteria group bacterium]
MTNVSVNYSDLQKYIGIASQISPKKHELEIITYTKIRADKSGLHLESTHLTYSVLADIPALVSDIQDELVFLIKTDVLVDCISSFNSEIIDFLIDPETQQVTIKANLSKAKLRINTDLTKDWKDLKNPDETEIIAQAQVLGSDLAKANRLSQIAVGQPKVVVQPEFLNVCYTLKPQDNVIAVVSSDRYRLSLTTITANYTEGLTGENVVTEPANVLIQSKIAVLLGRLADAQESVKVTFTRFEAWFELGNIKIYSQYVDGKYPDYMKIVPQSFACSLQVNRGDLLQAIKQVFFLSRNQFNKDITFQVKPSDKKIVITSKADALGESENEVNILEYEGDTTDWQQAFNATYFLDYLTLAEDEVLVWDANPGKPSVLSGKDNKAQGLYLVCGLNR